MLKVIVPGSWDFDAPISQLVKVSRAGLVGHDLREFVKRAGHEFADAIRHSELSADEVPVHLIAVGATEFYSANRNGDGFKEAACRKYHDTFEKHAHWFRNHDNRDPARSYGRVIKSAYNQRMHRIELLAGLTGSQKLAEFRGGLVADKELEKLANGEDLGVSMACTVPADYCSGCSNKARTRAEYCTASTCKYGGLAENMGRLAEDGHHLHADNREPDFFDISHVIKPADRIAYVLGKAASATVMGGAALAESLGLEAPTGLYDTDTLLGAARRQLKLAHQLAELERTTGPEAWDVACRSQQDTLPGVPDLQTHPWHLKQALHALAVERVLLPLPEFLSAMLGEKVAASVVQEAASCLPGIYGLLTQSRDLATKLAENPYTPADRASETLREWATKLAHTYQVSEPGARRRLQAATVRGEQPAQIKLASAPSAGAEKLATHYALYKLGFLAAQPQDAHFAFTTSFAVRMNHVL